MSAEARREAYRWVAGKIRRAFNDQLQIQDNLSLETIRAVEDIRRALAFAGAVEDGPGIDQHVGGNGKRNGAAK